MVMLTDEIMSSGNFFNELGLDLLNFKELGMGDISSVPPTLWNLKAEKPLKARIR
jgi:hypothetical protein